MNNIKYNTKQRSIILDLLISNSEKHLTADEMLELLKANNTPVGKATLYRYLDMLVSVGDVRKYLLEERSSACFQYIDNEHKCQEHYHLKCLDCGKLIHFECEPLDKAAAEIDQKYHFVIDISKVIFYGQCMECYDKAHQENV